MSKGRVLLFGRDVKRLLWRSELLRRLGFKTSLSENLEQAKQLCRDEPFQAAMIGPAVDAKERTQAIRWLQNECHLPVVLVTEGRTLSGVRADGYVTMEEEAHQLPTILESVMRTDVPQSWRGAI